MRRKCFEKNGRPALTESALYSPLDEPDVFVGFCFVLIIALSRILRLERELLSRLRLNRRWCSRQFPCTTRPPPKPASSCNSLDRSSWSPVKMLGLLSRVPLETCISAGRVFLVRQILSLPWYWLARPRAPSFSRVCSNDGFPYKTMLWHQLSFTQ